MSEDIIEKEIFLCPCCGEVLEYWNWTCIITEYGSVDPYGDHDTCDRECDDIKYSCPNCECEFYYEDVLLHIEIDNKNKKIVIETSDEHYRLDLDDIKNAIMKYFEDYKDYTIIIDGEDVSNFAKNINEFPIFDDCMMQEPKNENVTSNKTSLEDILL